MGEEDKANEKQIDLRRVEREKVFDTYHNLTLPNEHKKHNRYCWKRIISDLAGLSSSTASVLGGKKLTILWRRHSVQLKAQTFHLSSFHRNSIGGN